jgi:hypothetical protein
VFHLSVVIRWRIGGAETLNTLDWKSEHQAALAVAAIAGAALGIAIGFITTHQLFDFSDWLNYRLSDALMFTIVGAITGGSIVYCYQAFSS